MNRTTLSVSLVLATLPFASLAYATVEQNDAGRGMDAPNDIHAPWILEPGTYDGVLIPAQNDSIDWFLVEPPQQGIRKVFVNGSVTVDCVYESHANNTSFLKAFPCYKWTTELSNHDGDFQFGLRPLNSNATTSYTIQITDGPSPPQNDLGRGADAPNAREDAWLVEELGGTGEVDGHDDREDWYAFALEPTEPRGSVWGHTWDGVGRLDFRAVLLGSGTEWVFHDHFDLRLLPEDGVLLIGVTARGVETSEYYIRFYTERPVDVRVDSLSLREVPMGPTRSPTYRELSVEIVNDGPHDTMADLQISARGVYLYCGIHGAQVWMPAGSRIPLSFDLDTTGWVGSVQITATVTSAMPDTNRGNDAMTLRTDFIAPGPGNCARFLPGGIV